jgi:hypothetical protein
MEGCEEKVHLNPRRRENQGWMWMEEKWEEKGCGEIRRVTGVEERGEGEGILRKKIKLRDMGEWTWEKCGNKRIREVPRK